MTGFTPDGPFSEFDLRRAFSAEAAAVRPMADAARLEAGLRRADRVHTLRMAAISGVCVLAVTFGVLSLSGTNESSFVDTVDQPGIEEPTPDPTLPAIDDADTETVTVETTTTTTTVAVDTPEQPDHLTAPSTSTAPAQVSTTTVAPTTTAAPATTQAPATTTTTVPPSTTTTEPPATTTTTVAVSLTANARYGSCELDPPYDVYSGTAAPGATITISSPWSDTVQTIARSDGTWEITVFFPAAPENETFSVAFSDGTQSTALSFVRTA